MALAGDLADKKLRNLPAALDLPALERLPESQRYPPALGTTIVPVLIAELTQPDRQGCQRNSVRYRAERLSQHREAGRRETGAGRSRTDVHCRGISAISVVPRWLMLLICILPPNASTLSFRPISPDPLPRSAPPTPSS